MADRDHDVTAVLRSVSAGDAPPGDLFPLVYDELRRLAATQLRDERPDHTLQATALVHEAYLKLVDTNRMTWRDRAHFMAVAAQAIRRILVDYARRGAAQKRGGRAPIVELGEAAEVPAPGDGAFIPGLNEALEALAVEHPEKARVVELRYFGGLTVEETAEVMKVAPRTIKRYWFFARPWLFRYMTGQGEDVTLSDADEPGGDS